MVVHLAWLQPGPRIDRAIRTPATGMAGAGLLLLCFTALPWPPTVALGQTARNAGEPIAPLQPSEATDVAKVSLGELLFHDAALSGDRTVACASCHDLTAGGDDGHERPAGADGKPLDFNAPTIFNVSRNFRLNWRGEFRGIEEQNEAALLDPALMDASWNELLRRLQGDAGYLRRFAAAYGSAPTRDSVLDALASFQRSLITVNARFDRHLMGQRGVLTPEELRGYELFKEYGCIACHQGANVGGNLFQRFGIFADPFADRASIDDTDLGRFTVTGLEQDRHVFRVPSLRNVALTAPYFHNGRTASLEEAISIMARAQLGRELPQDDIASIARFLNTLTGEYRGRRLGEVRKP
jgi:cytochrome c peroxidase